MIPENTTPEGTVPYPRPAGTFEDDLPFAKVGYVSSQEGNHFEVSLQGPYL